MAGSERPAHLDLRARTEISLFTRSMVPVTLEITCSSSTYVPCPLLIELSPLHSWVGSPHELFRGGDSLSWSDDSIGRSSGRPLPQIVVSIYIHSIGILMVSALVGRPIIGECRDSSTLCDGEHKGLFLKSSDYAQDRLLLDPLSCCRSVQRKTDAHTRPAGSKDRITSLSRDPTFSLLRGTERPRYCMTQIPTKPRTPFSQQVSPLTRPIPLALPKTLMTP